MQDSPGQLPERAPDHRLVQNESRQIRHVSFPSRRRPPLLAPCRRNASELRRARAKAHASPARLNAATNGAVP
jgi:hypothetical protein